MKSRKLKNVLVTLVIVIMLIPNTVVIAADVGKEFETFNEERELYSLGEAVMIPVTTFKGFRISVNCDSNIVIPQSPYGTTNIVVAFTPVGDTKVNPGYKENSGKFQVNCIDDSEGYFETFQANEGSSQNSKIASVYGFSDLTNPTTTTHLQTNLRIRGLKSTNGIFRPLQIQVIDLSSNESIPITLCNVKVTDQVLNAEGAGIALSASAYNLAVGDTTTIDFGESIVWKNVTCQYSTIVDWKISNPSVISANSECTTSFWTIVRGLSEGTSTISAEVTIKDTSGQVIAKQATEPVTVTVGKRIERELKFDMSFNPIIIDKVGEAYTKQVGSLGTDGKGAIVIQNYSDGAITADGVAKISSNGANLVVTGMKQGATQLNIYTRDAEYMGPRTAMTSDGKGGDVVSWGTIPDESSDWYRTDSDGNVLSVSRGEHMNMQNTTMTLYVACQPVKGMSFEEPNSKMVVGEKKLVNVEFKGDRTDLPIYNERGVEMSNEALEWKITTVSQEDGLEVLSITKNGEITALNPGKALVGMVTPYYTKEIDENGVEMRIHNLIQCEVEVLKPEVLPTSLEFGNSEVIAFPGDEFQEIATVYPIEVFDKTITYESNNIGVVTVNSKTGKINCIAEGTAVITGTTSNGKTASYTINVMKKKIQPESIIMEETVNVSKGSIKKLIATVLPENAENKTIEWKSSNTNVAIIDPETGYVTALSNGATIITVSIPETEIKKTCILIVEEAKKEDPVEDPFENPTEYKIDETNNIISKVKTNTEISKVLSNIGATEDTKIYDEYGKEVTDKAKIIITGMKVIANNKMYTVSVEGDVTGAGKITLPGILRTIKHNLDLQKLEGVYFQAADLDGNGSIDMLDVIKMLKAYINA